MSINQESGLTPLKASKNFTGLARQSLNKLSTCARAKLVGILRWVEMKDKTDKVEKKEIERSDEKSENSFSLVPQLRLTSSDGKSSIGMAINLGKLSVDEFKEVINQTIELEGEIVAANASFEPSSVESLEAPPSHVIQITTGSDVRLLASDNLKVEFDLENYEKTIGLLEKYFGTSQNLSSLS